MNARTYTHVDISKIESKLEHGLHRFDDFLVIGTYGVNCLEITYACSSVPSCLTTAKSLCSGVGRPRRKPWTTCGVWGGGGGKGRERERERESKGEEGEGGRKKN